MLLESLPDPVIAALEIRDSWRSKVASTGPALEFIVSDLKRWPVGSTVRVAFLDGDAALHADIESATAQISETANLVLDFGKDDASGEYRRWTEADTEHAAEIRVSFDMTGYWSLVGTDSNDPTLVATGPIGGGAGQRSLNLGGYKNGKPEGWERTVRHEFMHALAFHHAHQNLRGPCAEEFRWEDDPGYQPTQDPRGAFIADSQGRSPGIYTYLGGAPNFWPRAKVDHNLKTKESPEVVVGPFDPASVMLYRFAAFFYKTSPSPCAPTGDGMNLSDGDKRGLTLLYPKVQSEIAAIQQRADAARKALEAVGGTEAEAATSPYAQRVSDLLAQSAG